MHTTQITRQDFLRDRQGREFCDLLEDPTLPFDTLLEFFNHRDRQQRMEESETLYKKAPLAAVIRDLESIQSLQDFMASSDPVQIKRFEQAVTILVRMVMERLGWQLVPRK